MNENKLIARLPALPAAGFFSDATHTIRTADGIALLSFDPKTRAGFIYEIESQIWTITAPIDFHTFVLRAAAVGCRLANDSESKYWFDACEAKSEGVRRGLN